MDVYNIPLVPMQLAGFLVERSAGDGVGRRGRPFIHFFVHGTAVTIIFQSFFDNRSFFSNDLPYLICDLCGNCL